MMGQNPFKGSRGQPNRPGYRRWQEANARRSKARDAYNRVRTDQDATVGTAWLELKLATADVLDVEGRHDEADATRRAAMEATT